MTTNETQAVLGLFGVSPLAVVHETSKLSQGLSRSAKQQGFCHSRPISQTASAVAGVQLQNSILTGEVVS